MANTEAAKTKEESNGFRVISGGELRRIFPECTVGVNCPRVLDFQAAQRGKPSEPSRGETRGLRNSGWRSRMLPIRITGREEHSDET